jgi:hypothetical protein
VSYRLLQALPFIALAAAVAELMAVVVLGWALVEMVAAVTGQ